MTIEEIQAISFKGSKPSRNLTNFELEEDLKELIVAYRASKELSETGSDSVIQNRAAVLMNFTMGQAFSLIRETTNRSKTPPPGSEEVLEGVKAILKERA